ncbi:hypothetical protein ACLKM7_11945 [Microbacterium sp. I2]|uniref:hypothetical protein n=1 Tax=Microbacterium sp. I2 TaxID=3391826 RepID=UPI003ED97E86
MPAEYSFESRWVLPGPPELVWRELERTLLPGGPRRAWWPGLTVTMPPRRLRVGERMVVTVHAPLGYRLRVLLEVTEIDPGRTLAATSTGDLRGVGRLSVAAAGAGATASGGGVGTVVVFEWDVQTRRPWMNIAAWLLRPVFEGAHAHVMRRGEAGLRARLAGGRSEPRNAGNPRI